MLWHAQVTYRVEGKGPVEGQCSFDLHVRVGAQPVLGSPWKVQLLPAFQVSGRWRDTKVLEFCLLWPLGMRWLQASETCVVGGVWQGLHAGTVGTRGTGMLQFQGPAAIAVDASCIYVADGDNHR